jgi:alkylmercury lyase
MRQKAQGTWITPTIVIGAEIGLGFDPEWIQTQMGTYAQGVYAGGNFMTEQRGGARNGIAERLAGATLSREEDDTRKVILKALATEGKAPSVHEVAHALMRPVEHVLKACRTLARHDLIIWRDDEARIISAYPFSGVPTAHQVLMEGHTTVYAMCTIDALGIPFMLGQGARIRSACFFCRKPVRVNIQDDLPLEAEPSRLVVWSSDRDGCCVAEVRCPLMNFFCDEGHLHAWLATSPDERGTILSLTEALDLGKAAFGRLLA